MIMIRWWAASIESGYECDHDLQSDMYFILASEPSCPKVRVSIHLLMSPSWS